ncbi:MAG: MMPL family transporter [Planctomycetaceae bacterium]|jgi:predicted RND superfamily exporter protein|nr:MMPL family transporter [Planctomycetaceae bacterium]
MAQSSLFYRNHGFRIILVVVFMLSFIWLGTKWTLKSNTNNVEDWLPAHDPQTQEYKWFLKNFPMESFVVISWEGCKIESFPDMKNDEDKIEQFAQRLVPEQTINNMSDWLNPQPIIAEIDTSLVRDRATNSRPLDSSETFSPEEKQAGVTRMTAAINDAVTASTETANVSSQNENNLSSQNSQITEAAESLNLPKKNYFKMVMTYPRLKRMLKEQYPDISEEEIRDRLSGTMIEPNGGSNTALMAYLKEKPQGKEANAVIAQVIHVAQELGIEPILPINHRTVVQKAFDNFAQMIQEMAYGRKTDTSGVIIGGTPVDNVSIAAEGERTLYRLAGFCALIGLGLAYACFRSIRLTTLVFCVAILSAGISLAFVSMTGSHCDTIMLSMPALIYILAMSGAIHLINYYHDAVRENGLIGAPERAIKLGWFPCFIAALTTAFGLASLGISELIPIKKFGIYSAFGVLGTLLMIFLFLPAMLYFFPSKKYAKIHVGEKLEKGEKHSRILQFWRFLGQRIINHCNPVAIVCTVIMLLLGVGLYKITPEVKMMKFYSKDAPIIVSYAWLEKHIGPLVPMEIVLKFDNAMCELTTVQRLRLVEEIAARLKSDEMPEIGGVLSAATMARLPNELYESGGLGGSAKRKIYETSANVKLDKNRPAIRDLVTVELAGDPTVDQLNLPKEETNWLKTNGITKIAQLIELPDGKGTERIPADVIAPYREIAHRWKKQHGIDLWRISARVWALGNQRRQTDVEDLAASGKKEIDNIDYSKLIDDVKERVQNVLTQENIRTIVDPLGDNINSPAAVAKNITIKGIDASYTGMVPLVYQTQHKLINGLFTSLIMAFVTIAVVFCLILKNIKAGFIVMLPNIFPVMIVFGYMGWRGILVDVGTMMTASVALGVAVDNTAHYVTWFRNAIRDGMQPRDAALTAYERCATAMTQSTLIGGCGLSAFMFSTFTPTQMFGIMMLAILSVSLIGDLVFLPALLNGPLGKYIVPQNIPNNNNERDNILQGSVLSKDENTFYLETSTESANTTAYDTPENANISFQLDFPHKTHPHPTVLLDQKQHHFDSVDQFVDK